MVTFVCRRLKFHLFCEELFLWTKCYRTVMDTDLDAWITHKGMEKGNIVVVFGAFDIVTFGLY